MTELETRIRKFVGEFCSDMCAEASERALLGVLDLHTNANDFYRGHHCVQIINGYSVQVWYDDSDDCPTVVAIAAGLGLLEEEG